MGHLARGMLALAWVGLSPALATPPRTATPAATATPPAPAATATPAAPAAAAPLDNSGHLYTLDAWGGVHAAGSAPAVSTNTYWKGWDIARGLAMLPDGSGGYVLDGYGAVHSAGSAPAASAADYFGFDIARSIALAPWATATAPAGWILDGFGAVHTFGNAPKVSASAYWAGWDIARSLLILPDSTPTSVGGYVMDGFGGLHPFGTAPAVSQSAYWSGWDIARAAVLLPSSTTAAPAGYLMDGWGGLHPFGSATPVSMSAYWRNWDIARAVASWSAATTASPGGWVMDGWGGLHPFGSAPSVIQGAYWPNWDIARGLGAAGNSSGGRNPTLPVSRMLNVPYFHQEHALTCEAAALRMALGKEGISVGEDTLMSAIGIDYSAGYRDSSGALHWSDPYALFVGSPDGSESALTGYGVYYPPVARVAAQYGGTVLLAGEGIGPATVYQQILAGHPVLAWVSYDRTYHAVYWYQAFDGRSVMFYPTEHAVTVVGVDAGNVLVNDPILGTGWWPKSVFESAYATFDDMALVLS